MKSRVIESRIIRILKAIAMVGIVTGSLMVKAEHSIDLKGLSLKNVNHPFADVITGGQPSLADLELLKKKGVKNIVNLRSKGEFDGYDEVAKAKAMGFNYVSLEIPGAAGVNLENAKKLDEILGNLEGMTLVHCASSNRVGALFSIRANVIEGKEIPEALAEGKKAGLKSLYNKTESLLNSLKK